MGEPTLRHQVVGLQCAIDVGSMDPDGGAHEHVLWPLCDLTIRLEEIAPFQRLEPEVVVVQIALVDDCIVESLSIRLDHCEDILRDQGCREARLRVNIIMEVADDL